MKEITLPEGYNYIGVFLTLACNYRCSYCLNHFGESSVPEKMLSGEEWVKGLNRLNSCAELPLTLQGGEPSLHPDFIYIINNLNPELNIDILTNLQFDPEEFIGKVNPERLRRDAPYASIRVSFHPEEIRIDRLIQKTLKMRDAGFSIGVWGILHPGEEKIALQAQKKFMEAGIDFRTKEFLGRYQGRLYGTYAYEGCLEEEKNITVDCKTSELLINSDGLVYRCHSDLYSGRNPLGSILDEDFAVSDLARECRVFGRCNPCDVKIKTNRFQEYGHTSVEIKKKCLA